MIRRLASIFGDARLRRIVIGIAIAVANVLWENRGRKHELPPHTEGNETPWN